MSPTSPEMKQIADSIRALKPGHQLVIWDKNSRYMTGLEVSLDVDINPAQPQYTFAIGYNHTSRGGDWDVELLDPSEFGLPSPVYSSQTAMKVLVKLFKNWQNIGLSAGAED